MSERNRKAAEASKGVCSDSSASQVATGGGSTGTSSARVEKELLRRYSTNPVQMAKLTANYNKSIERIEYTAEQSAVVPPPTPAHRDDSGRQEQPESRQIQKNLGEEQIQKRFVGNSITTSKYNIVTFIPIFLFEMFSRVAYLYFLAQAALSWWDEISPFSGVGATMALLFVLLVSGVKAIAEDVKRHNQDDITNNSPTTLIEDDGTKRPVKWKELKVGDIVRVKDDELFPADILCLKTGLRDKVCFIRTTNLDGESNLKIRKPVDIDAARQGKESTTSLTNEDTFQEENDQDKSFIFSERIRLECEVPNGNLHKFRGRLDVYKKGEDVGSNVSVSIPITMSEMLLRGTLLKNSNYVYGMVVYTGKETRIQKNAARVPLKVGSFDRFLNIQIAILIAVQAILCVLLAVGSYTWRENEGKDRQYLALDVYVQGNYEDGFVYVCLTFITFWILTSYMVPISLFVTMEIVKFWQAFMFINNDQHMTDLANPEDHAHARNSNLNEDLGKVQYVFSDKTGTLTSNDMQLRQVNIKGITYGKRDFRLEQFPLSERGFGALEAFDSKMSRSVNLLQENGYWEDLVSCGGSREYILSMPVSDPTLERIDSSGRRNLTSELNEHTAKKRGHRDVRSSLSSINTSANLIRSMSTYTESGAMITIDNKHVADYIFGWHMVDFWTNICLCHSLIIEDRQTEDGRIDKVFQGPSPDEVALVEAGRNVGFIFQERTKDGIRLNMQGHIVDFEVLNVMEFTSDRKRMSVVAKCSDGTLRVFCKGADNIMLNLLKPDLDRDLIQATEQALYDFSVKGLRTLVLGTRLISQQEYDDWDVKYQAAARSLTEDRESKINAIAEELEKNFELVGLTAIEDKLQDGVPHAIETLRLAGMKVWMITGDKMETAINIGISCNLISSQDVLRLTADSKAEAEEAIERLHNHADRVADSGHKVEIVVDGPSLVHILGTPLEHRLAELGAKCSGVVVCRSSPSQKAAIVKIMTDYEQRLVTSKPFLGRKAPWLVRWWRAENQRIQSKALGIGDGANDVAMIQASDVGIGIAGKEGRQAVNNSDYALIQFRHLIRLLLVHGQLSHYRLARLIKYSFFKNITFACILIFYQFYCGFSGLSLIDDISAAMYNVVFTSMPILLFSVLDRPMGSSTLMRFPQMYNHSDSLSTVVFWRTGILQGLIDGAICFFIPLYSISASGPEAIDGAWAVGKTIYVAILGAVTLEAGLVARYWTFLFFLFVFLSYFLVYPFFLLFPYVQRGFDIYDETQYGVAEDLFSTPIFWFIILSVYALTFGFRYFNRSVKWLFAPDDNMILAEHESRHGEFGNLMPEERTRLTALGLELDEDGHPNATNSEQEIDHIP